MSSSDHAAPHAREPVLRPLLDAVFGFFVWAGHFLFLYTAAAVGCALGLGQAGGATQSTLVVVLAIVTGAAGVAVVLHARRRYRQQRTVPALRLRMFVTVGGDALATLAIVWQIFPLWLVPLCV